MRQYKTKIKNAYILIYDRVEMFEQGKVNDIIDDTKTVAISVKELMKQYSMAKAIISASMPQIPNNV